MKEFDEDQAVLAMIKAAGVTNDDRNYDAVCQVLDLIYDYYDDNGSLEISLDDDDDMDEDVDAMVAYVSRHLAKSGDTLYSDAQIKAMIEAELDYEEECA